MIYGLPAPIKSWFRPIAYNILVANVSPSYLKHAEVEWQYCIISSRLNTVRGSEIIGEYQAFCMYQARFHICQDRIMLQVYHMQVAKLVERFNLAVVAKSTELYLIKSGM